MPQFGVPKCVVSVSLLLVGVARAEPRLSAPVAVFTGGGGYPNFRTPSLTSMPDGSLLAIAEGRSFDDPGFGTSDLDIVSRRSLDGGLTWGPIQVADTWAGGADSNPTTVLDSTTGRLFLLFNRWEGFLGTTNSQPGTTNNSAWVKYSDDNGVTWSSSANITATVKDYNNWNSVAFGPGSGIQATNGRLLIPAARWANGWASYAVYSSDHGQTWTRGQLLPGGNLSNENQFVQLADGRIHMEARANTAGDGPRVTSNSANGGLTWSTTSAGQASTSVHTAIERFSLQSPAGDINRILFTGPRGPDRTNLVVRTSYDETISFVNERLLYDGYSGYSDITIMQDGSVGVLFETGEARNLTFLKLNREWIEPPQRLKAFESFRYNASTIPTLNGGLLWNAGWTANPDLTGTSTAKKWQADLNYSNFPFANDGQRSAFFDNGGTLSRPLPSPIDLGVASTQYFSILVQQNNTGSDTESALESLDISLYAGAIKTISFGVRGDESAYFDVPGASGQTAANTIDKGIAYYLVTKLVPQPSGADQIFVKTFRSGDIVPEQDDGLGWTLVGTNGAGSSAVSDRIFIKGGALADWIVDEFRYGTSFGAVVSNALRYEWTTDGSGLWTNSTNWFDGAPAGAGTRAIFGAAITAPRTVTLDAARTVGTITFTSTSAQYTIAGASTLTLNGASGTSAIVVTGGTHTIVTPIVIQTDLRIAVVAGSTLITSGNQTAASGVDIIKSGSGRWDTKNFLADTFSITAGTVTILPVGGGAAASRTNVLSLLPTGSLDVNDAALIIDYDGDSPMPGILALVQSGRAGGSWNGPGIRSSTTAANVAHAIGAIEAASFGITSFGGQAVDPTTVLLRETLVGDTNLSASVDLDDFTVLAAQFGSSGSWAQGDFDYSGSVDLDDFTGLAANFGLSINFGARTVPEPTLAMAGALLLCCPRLRSRK